MRTENSIREINLAIAEALGLRAENLRKFELLCTPGSFPVVTAEYVVVDEAKLKQVVATYRLMPAAIDAINE